MFCYLMILHIGVSHVKICGVIFGDYAAFAAFWSSFTVSTWWTTGHREYERKHMVEVEVRVEEKAVI